MAGTGLTPMYQKQLETLGALDLTQLLVLEEKLRSQLKERELKFLEAYLKNFNVKNAAIAAGYPEASAQAAGYNLMKREHVQQYKRVMDQVIQMENRYAHHLITREVKDIAFFDAGDVLRQNEAGGIELDTEALKRHGKSIKKIVQNKKGVVVEFHDKMNALDMLAKHTGYYRADNEQKAAPTVQIFIPDNGRTIDISHTEEK